MNKIEKPLTKTLQDKPQVLSEACLWYIPCNNSEAKVNLKLGRYKKNPKEPETTQPKSELTLDQVELNVLIEFLRDNYKPFKDGVKDYVPVANKIDDKLLSAITSIINNPSQNNQLLELISDNNNLISSVNLLNRKKSVVEFDGMLKQDLKEQEWQTFFNKNSWLFGNEFTIIVDERDINTKKIADYLGISYDGFIDIIEIKRPNDTSLEFWDKNKDRNNFVPSKSLINAITQLSNYIYDLEKESNSLQTADRLGARITKPRGTLIFGRSDNWQPEHWKAFRILNSSYHNISIVTFDIILERAKRIINLK